MKKITYKSSGVNINKGEAFIKGIKSIFPKSKKSPISAFGSFFNLTKLLKDCKEPVLVSSADGVGTKLILAQELNKHSGVGIDLVAMNVNDIVCLGARPLFFLDYIACGELKPKVLLEVIRSIKIGLSACDCSLSGGETAEMPGMYKPDEYDLAGFCVGLLDKKNIIDGKRIKKGDILIGLESSGIHSNGYSLVRKALNKNDIKKYSKKLLKPTCIYVKPVLSLLKALGKDSKCIKGIAHVTGGAYYSKVTKILPKGLGMRIDKNCWNVPEIFKLIQTKGKISQKEMYKVFNMGIGMILVVSPKQAMKVAAYLQRHVYAHVIGEIITSKKKMTLV